MEMKVIGVGFGRTGTLSLKEALNDLGFGPCYHMTELMREPARGSSWWAAANGVQVDWGQVLSGYASTLDWPGCYFWRELVDAYPEAKVILTVRDPEQWYESVEKTIYQMHTRPSIREPAAAVTKVARRLTPELRAIGRLNKKTIWADTFEGRFEDKAYMIDRFQRHAQEVADYVPADRLLTYRPGDGWGPLCDFLGVEVPGHAYPRSNGGGDFYAVMRRHIAASLARPLALSGLGAAGAVATVAALAARRRRR